MRSCAAIIIDNISNIEEQVIEKLRQYNEYTKVAKATICTKEELIARIQKRGNVYNEFGKLTLEEKMEHVIKHGNLIEEEGLIKKWYNPNSKYKSFCIGGIFSDRLYNIKKDKFETYGEIEDIDFLKSIPKPIIPHKRQYNLIVYKHKPKNNIEKIFVACNRDKTDFTVFKRKSMYEKYMKTLIPHDYIDDSGWHSMNDGVENYYNYVQTELKKEDNKKKVIVIIEYMY